MTYPKKKWGQNFLVDPNIIKKIIHTLEIKSKDQILEIGPGKGALTFSIKAQKVFAIEIDKDLCDLLSRKKQKNLTIINEDILKTNIENLKINKVVGNLPYNISSQIIFKILKNNNWDTAIFMIQKELAERITSKEGSKQYGRISVMIQSLCDVKREFNVSPNCFSPKPNVSSTIISLKKKKKIIFDYDKFEYLVKKIFSQRRKKIKNTLTQISNYDELRKYTDKRPEQISVEDYIKIASQIKDLL
tara:strand:+ start:6900 stop:7637 length:738 start_codon:yes stop_codon:yes gene_type:complete